MDRTRVWPDFRPEHVLFEDEDFLFVHKPAFVSSQAARADRPDDVVTRLKAWLAATGAAQQLADELAQWLHRPDMGVVHRL